MDELGDYAKNKLNPEGNQVAVGRTNEALRLGYVLLWLFSRRLELSNPAEIDESEYQDLLLLQKFWESEDLRTKDYGKLMNAISKELNIFINGVDFPHTSEASVLDLHVKDAEYLDQIANTLGNLDGVVGFILSGNENCSQKLLSSLEKSNYSINVGSDSTKKRVQNQYSYREL